MHVTTRVGALAVAAATAVTAGVLAATPAQAASRAVGSFDTATSNVAGATGNLRVRGWAYDADKLSSPLEVAIYVNGTGRGRVLANVDRPDITALGKGPHAFDATLSVPGGASRVCAYAIGINAEGVPGGNNPLLGCKNVNVADGSPVGSLDRVASAGGINVVGWAADPDSFSAALDIHVYVDQGTPNAVGYALRGATTVARPDVQAAVGTGPRPGFNVTVPAAAGQHRACAYAIDLSGTPGGNTLLGCLGVTVS